MYAPGFDDLRSKNHFFRNFPSLKPSRTHYLLSFSNSFHYNCRWHTAHVALPISHSQIAMLSRKFRLQIRNRILCFATAVGPCSLSFGKTLGHVWPHDPCKRSEVRFCRCSNIRRSYLPNQSLRSIVQKFGMPESHVQKPQLKCKC